MTVTAMPTSDEATEEAPKKGRKKLVLIALVVLIAAGVAWFLFLRPSGPTEPKPGEVAPLEPIQVNLASGHYLRLGLALQLTETAHEVDGSKALDAAIGIFSGQPVAQVNDPAHREQLKAHLAEELDHLYHGDVLEVYFTEFVTQ